MLKPEIKSITVFVLSVVITMLVPIFLVVNYFGANPLRSTDLRDSNSISLFPQGWSFFTKDASTPLIHIFRTDINGKLILLNQRNFSATFFWGLSRENRILTHEINFIEETLLKDSVASYKLRTSAVDSIPFLTNGNALKYNTISIDRHFIPDLSGRYVIASQKRLPWFLLHRNPNYPSNFFIIPVEIIPHD